MDFGETKFVVIVLVYAVGGYWIITYVKKICQYKFVHDKGYFNVLFGSKYIANGYHMIYENDSFF